MYFFALIFALNSLSLTLSLPSETNAFDIVNQVTLDPNFSEETTSEPAEIRKQRTAPPPLFDFYAILDGVQTYLRSQVNLAEKSLNNLEIKARESFNLTGIFLNQLILESEIDLRQQIGSLRAQVEPSCFTAEGETQILKVVKAAKPEIRECGRVANTYSGKLLKKVVVDLHEFLPKLRSLQELAMPCLDEPGIGEKINCALEKMESGQELLTDMLFMVQDTINNVVNDFTANMKVANNCMAGVAANALKDVNAIVRKRRECAFNDTDRL